MRKENNQDKNVASYEEPKTKNVASSIKERPLPAPPVENPRDKKNLDASELFSLFTADIIKEDKIFTR